MKNYNTEREIWKDIEGYEGLYQVSNLGKVRSLRFGKVKQLKLITTSQNYKQVGLAKDGKRKFYLVHRLVAKTFLSNPQNLPIINHIDNNRSNNAISNLEWCTIAYNNKITKKRTGVSVIQKEKNGDIVRRYSSYTEAAESNEGYRVEGISKCAAGVLKTYKGFIWEKA